MKNRFVQVFWRDIAGIDSGEYSGAWFNKEQAMKYAQAVYDEYTYTVWKIIGETKDFIIIASTIDENPVNPIYSDVNMIMKSVIVKIKKL